MSSLNMARYTPRELEAAAAMINLVSGSSLEARGHEITAGRARYGHERIPADDINRGAPHGGQMANPSYPGHGIASHEREMPNNNHNQPTAANISSSEHALQAYLIRQQALAGIPRENMIRMRGPGDDAARERGQDSVNNVNSPSVLQFSNNGMNIPYIPPAQFTGVLQPFPGLEGHTAAQPVAEQAQETRSRLSSAIRRALSVSAMLNPNLASSRPPNDNRPQVSHSRTSRLPVARDSQARSTETRIVPSQNEEAQLVYRPQIRHWRQPLQLQPNGGARSSDRSLHSAGMNHGPVRGRANVLIAHNGFDLISAIANHPELALMLVVHLNVQDIINLIAVSKAFNALVKANLPIIVRAQANSKAPETTRIFPFVCYPKLCISTPSHENGGQTRIEPSLRWLSMIMHRQAAVDFIMNNMLSTGDGLPDRCALTLKKIWFLMDIPDNRRREWTVRNQRIWEDVDFLHAVFFIVRLDILMKRRSGNNHGNLRRLIFAQPSLDFLYRVFKGTAWRTDMEVLKDFVRWNHIAEPHEHGIWIFGVPEEEIGSLQWEGYGRTEKVNLLLGPCEVILAEATRRRLDLQAIYVAVFLWGDKKAYTTKDSENTMWDDEMRDEVEGSHVAWIDAVRLDHLRY